MIKNLVFSSVLFLQSCSNDNDTAIGRDVSVNVHPTAPDITVNVKDRVVVLSGLVKDSARWKATIEAARSTKGVKTVVDKLHIALPKPQ